MENGVHRKMVFDFFKKQKAKNTNLEKYIDQREIEALMEDEFMKRIKERIETSGGIKWVTGNTRAEVEEKKRAIIQADALEQADEIPCFQEYAEAYIRRYKQHKVSANTLVGYGTYLKHHLYPAFGGKKIDRITVNDVQDWMNDEADKGAARKEITNIMQLFTQIMDSAVEDEIILRNPCKSKRLKNPSTKEEKVLPYAPSVYKQFEAALPSISGEDDRLFAALSVYGGMRKGEILALRWEDIDLQTGFIHIQRAAQYAAKNVPTTKAPKTDNGVRDVPILEQMKPYLSEAEGKVGFILCGRKQKDKDRPMTHQAALTMLNRINEHFASCGIKEKFLTHRMRHTVLTLLNNSGTADDKSLQAWAGHADAAFTRRQYMAPQAEQLHKVSNGFSKYLAAM